MRDVHCTYSRAQTSLLVDSVRLSARGVSSVAQALLVWPHAEQRVEPPWRAAAAAVGEQCQQSSRAGQQGSSVEQSVVWSVME